MNEHDLDSLFAAARTPIAADTAAAERFLTRHRIQRQQVRQRHKRAGWVSALLASAAVIVGLSVLHSAPELSSSAAYQVYEGAMGDGW